MSKRVWDNWLIFSELIAAYFLGSLAWVAWQRGQISDIWVKNIWPYGLTIWLVVTFIFIDGGVWWLKNKRLLDKTTTKKLLIVALGSLLALIIPLIPLNIPRDNYFYFLTYFQSQAQGWQMIVWAWLVGLIIIWFWPIKLPNKWSKKLSSPWVIRSIIVGYIGLFLYLGFRLQTEVQTAAFDFGIYDHTLWQLAYRFSTENSINGFGNSFGAHFQPILFLLAPFYWLWNNPRMLIALEVLIIAAGAIPVYRLAKRRFNYPFLTLALVLAYLLFLGNRAALSFPFHPSTLLAPILLFAYDYFDQKRWGWHILFIVLALLVKENAGLYVATFGLVVIIMRREYWRLGLIYTVIGLSWVAIETKLILPAISGQSYSYFYYKVLGGNMREALITIISNPIYVISKMFNGVIKVRTFLMSLGSTGFLSLGSGYGLLLLPNLGEKLLSSRPAMSLSSAHYTAPLAFGLLVATIEAIGSLKNRFRVLTRLPWLRLVALVVLLATLAVTFNNKYANIYWQKGGLISYPWKKELKEAIEIIPRDAAVSAQSALAPQMTHRRFIYRYPEVKNAQYIILSLDSHRGPLTPTQYTDEIEKMLVSDKWGLIYSQGGVMVFEKDKPDCVQPTSKVIDYLEKR